MIIKNTRTKKLDWSIRDILEVVEVEVSDTFYCFVVKGSNDSLFLAFLSDHEMEEISIIEGNKIFTIKDTYHVLDYFNKIILE